MNYKNQRMPLNATQQRMASEGAIRWYVRAVRAQDAKDPIRFNEAKEMLELYA